VTVSGNQPEHEVLVIGSLIWTGHCLFPATGPGNAEDAAELSHRRCLGTVYTKSTGRTHVCPCSHHLLPDDYDCSACGYLIREAPALGLDEDGDPRYVHVDEAGNIYSVECP
jgi:hypothetical protein